MAVSTAPSESVPRPAKGLAEEGEAEGLVSHTPAQRNNEPGQSSAKRQLILMFLGVSLLMLLVGFVLGRDTAPKMPWSGSGDEDKDTAGTGEGKMKHTQVGKETKAPTPAPTVEETKEEPKVSKLPFDPERLRKAKRMARDQLDMLEQYWAPYTEQVLTGNTGLVFGFAGKNKAPTNPESFKRTVDLIARVLVHGEALKLGFIGSSVQCGHDNCYQDSFQVQMQRVIGSVFSEATGKDIDMRNGCQGGTCGDSYQNQIFCFRHMVGDDIDFLFYEWTYFEDHSAYQYHEAITRWATLLPKIPATIIINCDNNAWGRDSLPKAYARWGANGINLEAGLRAGPYAGKVWGAIGDGIHNTTRYGDDVLVTKKRRDSLGVVFRNWHPGPLGFQYVSDLTSYLFLRATIAAVDAILAEPNQAAKTWPKEPLEDLGDLPPLSFSQKDNPQLHKLASMTEDAPGCFTIQKSTFGRPQVQIADNPSDMLNPYRDQVVKLNSDSPNAWSTWVAPPNWQMVPREERNMGDVCRPPDSCAYFVEPKSGAKTPLVFRLPKMTVGLIALCGGSREAGKEVLIKPGAFEAEFDGKKMDPKSFSIHPFTKCLALQTEFKGPVENKKGHLYLAIFANQPLQISQVITA